MTETPVDRPVFTFAAITVSIAIFSVMNMFVKLASEAMPVPQILCFRSVIGLIPIGFLVWRSGKWRELIRTNRHSGHFARSFIGFFSMCCYFWSFALLPLANATAIHFASPLILTALSVVMLDERVGPHRWGAVLIGLAAVLFMLQPAGNGDPVGSLIAMCAAILGAFAMIAVRRLGDSEHALTIALYFTLYSAVFAGIWTLFTWQMPEDPRALLYLVAVGLLGGSAQVLLTYAYAKAPASYVSVFSYLAIIFATGLDLLVWGHLPPWQVGAGSIVVIACGLYVVWRETRRNQHLASDSMPVSAAEAAPTDADRADSTPGRG